MLPTSHLVPMNAPVMPARANAGSLADAFSEFIAASARLEHSYHELQKEVAQLRTDLEERNSALQKSLNENERMRLALQRLVGVLPCGVLVFDANREITLMNSEAMRLLDLDPVRVRTMAELAGRAQVELPILLGESRSDEGEQEVLVPTSTGQRWIAFRSRRVDAAPDAQGRPQQQTILILRDVSAQKEFEQEREAARNTVALAEVSAVLAHEIRNPLASLELFAGLIAEWEGAPEYVGHLQAGIRTLSATVNNVLRFNSAGHSHLSPIQLAATIQNSVEFMRPIAAQAGVELKFANHAAELKVAGDPNALQQVVLNLGCNAIRHMPGGGTLTIEVRPKMGSQGVAALVVVSDTGSGIPEGQIERIFEAGFSGNGQTPGLGLAVCNRIMQQHRGTIGVTSRVNSGSTFTLEFPAL